MDRSAPATRSSGRARPLRTAHSYIHRSAAGRHSLADGGTLKPELIHRRGWPPRHPGEINLVGAQTCCRLSGERAKF